MAYSKTQLIEANLLLLQRYEGLLKGKRFNIQEFKRKYATYSKKDLEQVNSRLLKKINIIKYKTI